MGRCSAGAAALLSAFPQAVAHSSHGGTRIGSLSSSTPSGTVGSTTVSALMSMENLRRLELTPQSFSSTVSSTLSGRGSSAFPSTQGPNPVAITSKVPSDALGPLSGSVLTVTAVVLNLD